MERTSSKSGLLIETTSYDQDLSAHSNPLASASEHSGLHAVSSTPIDEQPPHPLASTAHTPSMSMNTQQMGETMEKNSSTLPPSAAMSGAPQYHINLSDTDVLMRRAHEMGLLDPMNPLNSSALPQFQRLLAANLSTKLQGDLANMQMQQLQHPLLHLPTQQQRFSLDEKSAHPTHQYNLSTITEQTSSNGSQTDSVGVGSVPPPFTGSSNLPSSASAVNGFGSGAGGITSLTAPSPIQQVIGALQSSQQQQVQERRPSRFNRAAASFRRSRRSWSSRRKRDSSGGSDRRGSNDSSKFYRKPKPPPVGFNCDANDASSEENIPI